MMVFWCWWCSGGRVLAVLFNVVFVVFCWCSVAVFGGSGGVFVVLILCIALIIHYIIAPLSPPNCFSLVLFRYSSIILSVPPMVTVGIFYQQCELWDRLIVPCISIVGC